MKMKQVFRATTLLFLLLMFSCSSNNTYNLLVAFPKVDGLQEKAEVKINDYKIGTVKKMEVVNQKIIATLTIDSETKISNQAVFTIKNADLLGTKYIAIENVAGSNKYLSDGDEITGRYDADIITTPISIDTLVQKIAKPILDSLGYDVTPKQNNQITTTK